MSIEQQYADLWTLQAKAWTVAADLEEKLQEVGPSLEAIKATISALSLERDSLSAANIGLQSQLDTARQEIADLKAKIPPEPVPEPEQTWAEKYGVYGDGVHDDTLAIQKAIDAGDAKSVPAGRYLINSTRVPSGTSFYGLLVGPGKRLECDPNAVFVIKPNAAPRNMCIRVEGGAMVGGQVVGDRLQHNYVDTGNSLRTHEWGYGVQLRGTGSTAQGVKVRQCTGDGFGLSGTDVSIVECESTENRRQGLSIFTVVRGKVLRSKFTKTGALGTNPGTNPRCGIDVEPDTGWADDLLIDDCDIADNEVTGLVGWIRSDVNGGIRGLVVRNCRISGVNAIHMKALRNSISASVEGCTVKRTKSDRGNGLKVETGATIAASGNTFGGVTARTPFEVTGRSSRTSADIATPAQDPGQSLGVVNAGTNRYV